MFIYKVLPCTITADDQYYLVDLIQDKRPPARKKSLSIDLKATIWTLHIKHVSAWISGSSSLKNRAEFEFEIVCASALFYTANTHIYIYTLAHTHAYKHTNTHKSTYTQYIYTQMDKYRLRHTHTSNVPFHIDILNLIFIKVFVVQICQCFHYVYAIKPCTVCL